MVTAHDADGAVPRGTLFAVGGAEDKLRRRAVLRRFVEAASAAGATATPTIAVVPTASSMGPEIVEVYAAAFTRLGAGDVVAVRPTTRAQAADPTLAAALAAADGIFMTGGNQLKLSAVVSGTAVGDAIVRAYEGGAAVGGTSAGASVLAAHMVAFGSGGATPKQRMSQLAAGLGLLPGVVIDQHFAQRNRYGRLLSLVAQSPALLGIGVDEDTAAIVTGGRVLEVAGRGAVTVVDGHDVATNAHEARRTDPLLVSGAVLHVLPAGARFDLRTRTLLDTVLAPPSDEVRDVLGAEASLRALAQTIALEGADPDELERRRRRAVRDALARMTGSVDLAGASTAGAQDHGGAPVDQPPVGPDPRSRRTGREALS